MSSPSDLAEMLSRSPLLAELEPETRTDLALKFEIRPFTAGQTLLADGAEGRELMEILSGTADVFVREDHHRYRVATLEPGDLAGEHGFFSGDTRGADVVGSSEGIVAVLTWEAYRSLTQAAHPGAAQLELAVLNSMRDRTLKTNARLGALVDATKTDGFRATFARLFGRVQAAPVVTHD
ncbi:MAG: Crp/Fnr family transcriptional regulator [Myxococcota bacterium]|nr:Crp/Fnr family transcriptional regulator [Myxococcota bacterium]MEC9390070.1 Crp/Fnr family transcriptional regulator [Myxococcota bacterium]